MDDLFGKYLKSESLEKTLDLSGKSMIECIDKYLEIKTLSKSLDNQTRYVKTCFKELENLFGITIMPYQITDIFWANMYAYLVGLGKIKISSFETLHSNAKIVLGWASRFSVELSPSWDLFKIPSYNISKIALTISDISRIYNFDLNTIPRKLQYRKSLEKVRDMFVLSCNLGQRYSDMLKLNPEQFKNGILKLTQQKTGFTSTVDINKYSLDPKITKEILKKYDYTAPYKSTIGNYNYYLHQLCQYIGFSEIIQIDTKINGKIKTTKFPKYELITSHTARRSFVTNNILRGYKISEVRIASGHRSENTFIKYIRTITDDIEL